jgi:hypothetical protein
MLSRRQRGGLYNMRIRPRASFINAGYRHVRMRKHVSSLYPQIEYLEHVSLMINGSLFETLKRILYR